MKKLWMAPILLAGMLWAPSASALISEFTLPSDTSVKVTVESTVTELIPGSEYLYTYQIKAIGPDQNISLLSVPFPSPLLNSTEIYDFAVDGDTPYYWGAIDDPAIAAHAFFAPSSLTGEDSAILKFKSIYAAEHVQGYVNDARLGSLYGVLLAPVPEPLTLSLFAIGAGFVVCKKKKNIVR